MGISYRDFEHRITRGDDEEFPFVVRDAGSAELAIAGTPTGGTFTLTFRDRTTAPIAYNAGSAAVQAALAELASIPNGSVTCSGGALPGTAVTITFGGLLSGADPTAISVDDSGLTGGTSPEVELRPKRQDLTAWTEFWFTGKTSLGGGDVAAVFQRTLTGGGISLTSASQGEGKVTLVPASYPSTLAYDRETILYCDLQGKDGDGKIHTLATGKLIVGAETTRSA
jgi:hypothetical protein